MIDFIHISVVKITPIQHDFMKSHSSVTNLFDVTQFIFARIDKGTETDKLSKADRFDHRRLLTKLFKHVLSLSHIHLFMSDLTDR